MKRIGKGLIQIAILIAVCISASSAFATDSAYGIKWWGQEGGCRTADGGRGSYVVYKNISLDVCQSKCWNPKKGPECTAVEYNPTNRSCEVHSKPIEKTTGSSRAKTTCYLWRWDR